MNNPIKITMDDYQLENFVLNLLSFPKQLTYKTEFASLEINKNIKDKHLLQQKIFIWLKRRMSTEEQNFDDTLCQDLNDFHLRMNELHKKLKNREKETKEDKING